MEKEVKNILIIGRRAASSALAKKLAKNDSVGKIFVAPGNGIKSDFYENVDIREDDLTGLLKFVLENDISLTIPASEKALRADVVSFFMENDQNIFGPTKNAANFALSNAYGKKFLYKIHAQTSKFGIFDKLNVAEDWIKTATFPITIKCNQYDNLGDRLVCPTISLAEQFLDNLFSKNESDVLIEEYTYGHIFTIYYVTDGYTAHSIGCVGNYKFLEDGDGGILTNGVGCYSPDYKVSETVYSRVENVVRNTLVALDKKGEPYVGILGVECIMTGEDKFYISEFKPFLQDFDASCILSLLEDDIVDISNACIQGLFSDEYDCIKLNGRSAISAVIYSRSEGKLVKGLEKIDDIENVDFINYKSQGGRVGTVKGENFVLTRSASTITRAKNYLYEDLEQINFDGIKYRKDICIN